MHKDNKGKEVKTPNVYWFQTFDKVIIHIEELNLQANKAKIEIFFKKMTFKIDSPTGIHFKFDIDFYSDVFKDIAIDSKERYLKLIITKKENQFWPRLTREKETFSWIKLDHQNFIEECDDDTIVQDTGMEFDYELKENQIEEINYNIAEFKDKINEIQSKLFKSN